jgi:hypothetical protein
MYCCAQLTRLEVLSIMFERVALILHIPETLGLILAWRSAILTVVFLLNTSR